VNYFLGIDIGGTTTIAAIYDQGGREIAISKAATETTVRHAGYAERDMELMWQTICTLISEVIERSGVDPAAIACVACCGHGKGLYLWGNDDKPAYQGICSTDARAEQYLVKWRASGVEKEVFALSKQHILACQPVSLLAWMKDHTPEVLARTQYIFGCKDYVRFRLTGVATLERTDASGSNLINLETLTYDPALLRLFGLEECLEKLPPLVSSVDICGTVTDDVAKATGLAAGTPVAGGAFDIDACAVTAKVFDDTHVCMIAGTWSINEYVAKAPITDGSVLMNSCFCIPNTYLIEESSPTSAGNLEWYVTNLLSTVSPEFRGAKAARYAHLDGWVKELPPDAPCPIFLPFVLGRYAGSSARGSFVGIEKTHTHQHMVKAIFEGIALSHRWHYQRLLRSMPSPPKAIRLVGGVGNSTVWTEIFAHVMNKPIEVMAAREAGTLGCAIIAAAAVAHYPSLQEAADAMSKIEYTIHPDGDLVQYYDGRFTAFNKILDALDPVW
jgi:L-xylulokinase